MSDEYRPDTGTRCSACARVLPPTEVVYTPEGAISCSSCEKESRVSKASSLEGSVKQSWLKGLALEVSKLMRKSGF